MTRPAIVEVGPARPSSFWRSGVLTLLMLVAVACGGGGGEDDDEAVAADDESIFEDAPTTESTVEQTTTTAATSLDPCALVTKQDAEVVAGTALEDATPAPESCTYVGPVTGPTAQFEVYVGDGANKFLEIDRDLQHVFEELPGVGDEAYLEDGTAFVRSGDQWVALRVVRLDDPAVYRQAMIDLATTVAGRM